MIWDYDGGIGQVNASLPYNFNQERISQEIENVDRILEISAEYNTRMTFACVGFTAEDGPLPYHNPDQIRKIWSAGHEIASHSWKHEWFPYLNSEQIQRSLSRSKQILESCIGAPGSIRGFVPPFNRPMSWYRKGAFSLGDRVFGPSFPGADLGRLIKILDASGYQWCRVSVTPIWKKLLGRGAPRNRTFFRERSVLAVPQHYVGFDETAVDLLEQAISTRSTLVISGHPSGLSRSGAESLENFLSLMQIVSEAVQRGDLQMLRVCDVIDE